MMRSFKITLPADTNQHNLYSLIVGSLYNLANGGTNETGVTGAIPTGGIFPDRVMSLGIVADAANTGQTIKINDNNNANTTGQALGPGVEYSASSAPINAICLKDYFLQGSAASLVFELNILAK